jgi:hypothetical protein
LHDEKVRRVLWFAWVRSVLTRSGRAYSAVTVPVITLGAMRRLCTLDAQRVDITFAEYCMALYLFDQGLVAGFYPIVIGEQRVEPHSGKTVLDNLFHNATFKALRGMLPTTCPTATWRFVARTLAGVGHELPPSWEAMSVADVMCGSARMHASAPTSGVFLKDCYFLEGDEGKLRLLLMREFAEKVRRRIGIATAELNAAAGEVALAAAVQYRDRLAAPAAKDDELAPCTPPRAAGSNMPPRQSAGGAARVAQAALSHLLHLFSFGIFRSKPPPAARNGDRAAPLPQAAPPPESDAGTEVLDAPLHFNLAGKHAPDATPHVMMQSA